VLSHFKRGAGSWGPAIDPAEHSVNPEAGGVSITLDGSYLFSHHHSQRY
jgi:hypothetical protein